MPEQSHTAKKGFIYKPDTEFHIENNLCCQEPDNDYKDYEIVCSHCPTIYLYFIKMY